MSAVGRGLWCLAIMSKKVSRGIRPICAGNFFPATPLKGYNFVSMICRSALPSVEHLEVPGVQDALSALRMRGRCEELGT